MPHWVRALILLALLGSAGRAQAPSEWKTFTHAQGRFSVRVPGTPAEDDAEKKPDDSSPVSHTFTLTYKDTAYILSFTDFPPNQIAAAPPAAFLKAARDGGVNNVKGKLISESEIKVNGFPGRDVIASLPLDGKQGSAHFRIVLAKNRLYMALFVGPGGSAGQARVDTFLKSFQILPSEPQDGWQNFTSDDGGYTVRMPAKPTEDTADLPNGGKIHRATLDKGAIAYIISYNQIAGGMPAADVIPTLLNKGRDSLVSALKGKLVEDKPAMLDGNSGKTVRISMPASASTAYVRIFVVGDRFYQVMLLGENKALEGAGVDRYLDSYKFVPRERSSAWANFTPPDGNFTIDMPGKPTQDKLSNVTMKYQAALGGTIYIVVTSDIKEPISDPDRITAVLESAKDEETKALDAKALSQKRVPLGDVSGLQVNLSIPVSKIPGGGYGIERFFVIGKRVYEIAVITSDKKAEESDFARFFDSFKATAP